MTEPLTIAPAGFASPTYALRTEWRNAAPAERALVGTGERVVLYSSAECWRGAGISFVHIARGLSNHGFRAQVVALDEEVSREFQAAGVPVSLGPRGRGEAWRLRRYLGAFGAEAVIVDRVHDLRVAALATAGTRVAVIYRYNHFIAKAPTDILVRAAYGAVVREVVFLSAIARERVLREAPAFMRRVPPTTIHEGVDVDEFRPSRRAAVEFRRAFDIGPQPFLLAVGALSAEKRYEALFEAVQQLGESAPLLVVCGEGVEDWTLRQRAIALGIRVRFIGRVARSMIIGAYSASLGLVHAGASETFGLAVLEAMACARPVVVSAGGALPEVVGEDGSCGTLVTGGEPRDLSAALGRLLDDPEEAAAMGTRARARAASLFSLAGMERQYAELVARHTRHSAR